MLCQKKQGTNRALLKFLGLLTSANVGKKIEKWLENIEKTGLCKFSETINIKKLIKVV
ncbi:hypothetical protein FLGSB24_18680 [Flavobacterium sp. GSB-24]|nr:hypothetical protein FLGSB24_18680 [Flavobacterium sp. GSB-24]